LSFLFFIFVTIIAGSAWAQTHDAHEHGVANLDLAVGSDGFDLDLDSP
jgi:hypothetical protein